MLISRYMCVKKVCGLIYFQFSSTNVLGIQINSSSNCYSSLPRWLDVGRLFIISRLIALATFNNLFTTLIQASVRRKAKTTLFTISVRKRRNFYGKSPVDIAFPDVPNDVTGGTVVTADKYVPHNRYFKKGFSNSYF